jgi:SAM-dependent methyltransferase
VKRRTEGGRGPGRASERPRRVHAERPGAERRTPRADAEIEIRYRDRDIAVLELPADAARSESEWLAALRERLATRGSIWAISRLERGASGLVLVALGDAARTALARDERTQVRYFAVVEAQGDADETTAGPAPNVLAAQGGRALVSLEQRANAESVVAALQRRGFELVHEAGRRHLHTGGISLSHPESGKWLSFESPAPQQLWRAVGSKHPSSGSTSESVETPHAAPALPKTRKRAARGEETTHWDQVADWFDGLLEERRHDHYRDLVLPGTLRLLEIEAGARVLDVACGQGVLSRALAEQGVEAVGIDASERLILLARKRSAGLDPRPEFHVADVRALGELELEPFERAACVMALSNIDPIEPVLRGCAELLREGGRFVAVIPHPAFRIPRRSRWEWDRDEAGQVRQSRRIDAYLSPARVAILANPGEAAHGGTAVQTWTFHRPLQHYVNGLAQVGLAVDRIEEWASARVSDSGPRAPEENRARREIPLFLALRARRLRTV